MGTKVMRLSEIRSPLGNRSELAWLEWLLVLLNVSLICVALISA